MYCREISVFFFSAIKIKKVRDSKFHKKIDKRESEEAWLKNWIVRINSIKEFQINLKSAQKSGVVFPM